MDNVARSADEHRAWWEKNAPVPYGYCWCRCGQEAPRATNTWPIKGYFKGLPKRFIHNHNTRKFFGPEYLEEDRGFGSPCWIWQHSTGRKGYGYARVKGGSRLAHRVYYEKLRGPIPDGLSLDHLCAVPPCVNPWHTEPVTHAENMRRRRGAQLPDETLAAIRVLHESGFTFEEIIRAFSITYKYGMTEDHITFALEAATR